MSCVRTVLAFTLLALVAHADGGGVAWYGTWEGGLAAARKTGRPILLLSAAPHCHNISGIW